MIIQILIYLMKNSLKKNKDKVYFEINGNNNELKSQQKFENNERIISIKLIYRRNFKMEKNKNNKPI
jgi:hypothetical protein